MALSVLLFATTWLTPLLHLVLIFRSVNDFNAVGVVVGHLGVLCVLRKAINTAVDDAKTIEV